MENETGSHPHATVGQHEIEMEASFELSGLRTADAKMKSGKSFVEENIGGHKLRNTIIGADSNFRHLVAVRFSEKLPQQIARQAMPAIGVHHFPLNDAKCNG